MNFSYQKNSFCLFASNIFLCVYRSFSNSHHHVIIDCARSHTSSQRYVIQLFILLCIFLLQLFFFAHYAGTLFGDSPIHFPNTSQIHPDRQIKVLSREILPQAFSFASYPTQQLAAATQAQQPPAIVLLKGNDRTDDVPLYSLTDLKNEMQNFFRTEIKSVVEQCFKDNFEKMAAQLHDATVPSAPSRLDEDSPENHVPINDEEGAAKFNTRLGESGVMAQYVSNFKHTRNSISILYLFYSTFFSS